MSWPHPLDYEWRPFTGAYFKIHYDVRIRKPDGTEVISGPYWPNGGRICTEDGDLLPGSCDIVADSVWFTMSPLPGDQYQIGVKEKHAELLDSYAHNDNMYDEASRTVVITKEEVRGLDHFLNVVSDFGDVQHMTGVELVTVLQRIAMAVVPPRPKLKPLCPYCGLADVREVAAWSARSDEERNNSAKLTEWQCAGKCEGRSFWL